MAQKLKKASLMFGQVDKEPPKPTLSGFYGGVGKGQTEAVKTIGQETRKEAEAVPGAFGLTYTDGKAGFAEGSTFKPTVDIKTTTSSVAPPEGGFKTSADAAAAAAAAGKNIQTLSDEQKAATAALDKSTTASEEAAGKVSEGLQEKLTKGKLGERREASELEKQAQDYRNVLTDTPGTSNIGAVKNLMRFYDQSKYGALESGLRQGEIALARQQAGTVEAGLQQAEGERVGAVQQFKDTSEQAYKDIKDQISKEKETKLEEIKKFYDSEAGKQKTAKETAELKRDELKKVEDEMDVKNLGVAGDAIKNNDTVPQIDKILKAISGMAGDNWLNVRGHEVLAPIKGEIQGLTEQAIAVQNDPALSIKDRTKKLEDINKEINTYKNKVAGELAAFLGDSNTQQGDAIHAAELIAYTGLTDSLSPEQKSTILKRLETAMTMGIGDEMTAKAIRVYTSFGGNEKRANFIVQDAKTTAAEQAAYDRFG